MEDIFKLLRVHDYLEGDELCQIACGKYELRKGESRWRRFINNTKRFLAQKRIEMEYKRFLKNNKEE